MLNCQQTARLLSEAQDRKLSWSETINLKAHTMLCSACNNFAGQIGFISMAVGKYAKGECDENLEDNSP